MLMKNRKLCIAFILILCLAAVIVVLRNLSFAEPEVYEDIEGYAERLSDSGNEKWHKWNMDESIWPSQISDDMTISGYRMVYYDPFDAQYLGYMKVQYTDAAYADELERLGSCPSDEYAGIYSVKEKQNMRSQPFTLIRITGSYMPSSLIRIRLFTANRSSATISWIWIMRNTSPKNTCLTDLTLLRTTRTERK